MIQEVSEEVFKHVMNEAEFMVHYQPIVSIGKGQIIGMESLLRASYHGEQISPEPLFAYAKIKQKLFELDLQCHKHAMQEYSKGNSDSLLFVNVEASLLEEYLKNLDNLLEKVDSYGIPRDSIVVEINEKNTERVDLLSSISLACRNAGFLVALDDVGAGHSNLRRIIEVGPDIIKIDRSVIEKINVNYRKQEVLRATTELGQKIGAITIAEGVEKKEEIISCLLCGVDWYQGFYFDKAMPPDLIKTKSYNEKCRMMAELYHKEAVQKMKTHVDILDEEQEAFQTLFQSLASSKEIEQNSILQQYLSMYDFIECVYIINEDGIQLTDTIFHPTVTRRNGKMFSPMKKGDYHISKQYFYSVVHNPGKIFISPRYISQATGSFCHTISSSFINDSGVRIVCVDFQAAYKEI